MAFKGILSIRDKFNFALISHKKTVYKLDDIELNHNNHNIMYQQFLMMLLANHRQAFAMV